jgi:hypothetical protein
MTQPRPRLANLALDLWRGTIQAPRAEIDMQHRYGQDGDIIQQTGTLMPEDSPIECTAWAVTRADAYLAKAQLEALTHSTVQAVDAHDILWPSVLVMNMHVRIVKTVPQEHKPTRTGRQQSVQFRLDITTTLRAQTGPQI